MAAKTTIYIVRHGESTHNRDGLIGGGEENPQLTDLGRKQAHQVKQDLAHIKFDKVFSSDLDRAIDTASIIHGQKVPTQNQLVELRERSFGLLDGKPDHLLSGYDVAKMSQPKHLRKHYVHVDNMESDHVLFDRYIKALTKIAVENPGKVLLIGAHGSALRVLLIHLGWATYEEFPSGSFRNGDYVKLVFEGKDLKVEELFRVSLKDASD